MRFPLPHEDLTSLAAGRFSRRGRLPEECFLVSTLTAVGYHVSTTDGALSALSILDAGEIPRVDLPITEARTALFRGDDFARWIRHRHPRVQRLVMSDTAPEAKTSAYQWLPTAFDQPLLIGTVRALLTSIPVAA